MNTTRRFIEDIWTGFLDLVYPPLCIVCNGKTYSAEHIFCLHCQSHIGASNMYRHSENEFTARFAGRVKIQTGAALFYYLKGGKVQQLIERLKYKREADIGINLGRYFGKLLTGQEPYCSANLILPVPLHPKRKAIRGYNQASLIAMGLSESLNIPMSDRYLKRIKETNSQVSKNRQQRMENMSDAFSLQEMHKLEQLEVILVDDVLTTGSTLESCAALLLKVKGIKVSILCLGITSS